MYLVGCIRICRSGTGHLPKWRYHPTYGGEHACPPVDTQLFHRGLLAGHSNGSRDAGLLPQASRKKCEECHRKGGQKTTEQDIGGDKDGDPL